MEPAGTIVISDQSSQSPSGTGRNIAMSRIHPYILPPDPYHACTPLSWKAKVSQLVIIRTVHYLESVVREKEAMTPRRDISDQ